MPSHYILANYARKEYINPHEFGEDPRLPIYEYTDDFVGSLVFLKKMIPHTGLISNEHEFLYAGKWYGEKLNIIGEKEQPSIYNTVTGEFENISQPVRQEWNCFLENFDVDSGYKGKSLITPSDHSHRLDGWHVLEAVEGVL